jgi:hypothetical protein
LGGPNFDMSEANASEPARRKRPASVIFVGCVVFAVLLAGGAVAIYLALKPKELRAPLLIALPNCRAGIYKPPKTTTMDTFDRAADDVQRRACEGSKNLQGTAILSPHTLTLQVHNSDYFPLTSVELRLILTPNYATSYERMYRLEGNVPPLADGELRISTNLEPKNLRSFSPVLTWAWFDNKVPPADAVDLPVKK